MNFIPIIAVDPPTDGSPPKSNPMGSMWVFFILMFVMMYFLIIRPQSKQRKEAAARIASMEKGDKVITIGGLHGIIHHVGKKTVTLKIAEGIFIPFEKDAMRTVNKVRSGKKEDGGPEDEDEKPEGDEKK